MMHDLGALNYVGKIAVGSFRAYAAGYVAVFCKSVLHLIAYHAVVVEIGILVVFKEVVHYLESLGAVVVIGIDYCKITLHKVS